MNTKEDLKAERAQRKLDEKNRLLMEERQMMVEQYKTEKYQFGLRMGMLRETNKYIENLAKIAGKILTGRDKLEKWQIYIKCENRPNPKIPAELRRFIFKWKEDLGEIYKKYMDWMVEADDRIILTHDYRVPDKTFEHIRSNQPCVGDIHAKKLDEALIILDELQHVLNTENLPQQTMNELLMIKKEIRDAMNHCLDFFTYYVLRDLESHMSFPDELTCMYEYKSICTSVNFFTFKNVPLPLDITDDGTSVKFPEIKLELNCPMQMSFDGYAIRCIWSNYDHFSDMAQSFNLRVTPEPCLNLRDQTKKEWEIRTGLVDAQLDIMRQNRANYELWLKEQEDVLKKKDPKDKKPKFEPPIVTEDTFVDVSNDYNYLLKKAETEKMDSFNPFVLMLESNELNLRNFRILGGTYSVHYLVRPVQSRKFGNNLIYKRIYRPDTLQYVDYSSDYQHLNKHLESSLSLTIDQKNELIKKNKEQFDALVQIKMKLPENVFWYVEPIVCRWEIWEESESFQALEPELQYFNIHYDEIQDAAAKSLFSNIIPDNSLITAPIEDIDLLNMREGVRVHYFFSNYIVPRMTATYKFEIEQVDDKEKYRNEMKRREMLIEELEDAKKAQIKRLVDEKKAVQQEKFQRHLEKMRILDEDENAVISSSSEEEQEQVEETYSQHSFMKKQLTFKSFVQGAVAKNLFLFLERIEPLEFREQVIQDILDRTNNNNRDSYFLSELMKKIRQFGIEEIPSFATFDELKEKYKIKKIFPKVRRKSSRRRTTELKLLERQSQIEDDSADDVKSKRRSRRKTMSMISGRESKLKRESTFKKDSVDKKDERRESRKSKKMSKRSDTQIDVIEIPENIVELKLIPHNEGMWSTKGIFVENYDRKTNIITFRTNKLGTFGFAANIYQNFPLKHWEIIPISEKPAVVQLKITTNFLLKIEINITVDGYSLTINQKKSDYVPLTPIEKQPMKLREMIKYLQEAGLNIFPAIDGFWYCNNNSYKHESMLDTTYKAIGHFCLTHNIKRSPWNRISDDRIVIIESKELIENRNEPFRQIKITPENVYFVRTEELCTPIDKISLVYKLDPPEQDYNSDIYTLLTSYSIEKQKKKQNNTHIMLKWNVSEIFAALNPLSYD